MDPEKQVSILATLKESPRRLLWHLACQRRLRPEPDKPALAKEQIWMFHSHRELSSRFFGQLVGHDLIINGQGFVNGTMGSRCHE